MDPLRHLQLEATSPSGAAFTEVERRETIDEKTFVEEFEKPNRPVVITGMKFWRDEPFSLDLLARLSGKTKLRDLGAYFGEVDFSETHEKKYATIEAYVERMKELESLETAQGQFGRESSGLPYLTNMLMKRSFPELLRQFAPPPFRRKPPAWAVRFLPFFQGLEHEELFIGPPDTSYGTLHFDTIRMNVVSYQLFGRKQWTLFAPSDSKYLYPKSSDGFWVPNHSPIEPHNPDLRRYPLFAQARGYTTVLNAGEFIYCPASWWHTTYNRSNSVSIAIRDIARSHVPQAFKEWRMLVELGKRKDRYIRHVVDRV
jgi:hypothetical protein